MPSTQSQIARKANARSRVIPETPDGTLVNNLDMDCWMRTQSILISRTIDMAETMNLFMHTRRRANLDAWNSLTSCRHSAEVVGVQWGYLVRAVTQYRDHAQELSRKFQQDIVSLGPDRADGPQM